MALRRYVASGRGGGGAVAAVLGVSLAGGVIAGVIEGIVDQWFAILLVFPLLIGVVAGLLAVGMINRFRLRAPLIAALAGALGGTAGYAACHVVEYMRFRSAVSDAIVADQPALSAADRSAALDTMLEHETGQRGFRGYLEIAARNGVSIKRMGAGDKGLSLTGVGAWLLWLCELLAAALTAAFIAGSRAREPYCEDCDGWYGPVRLITSGGAGTKAARTQLVDALGTGDHATAAAQLTAPASRNYKFALTASTCPRCAGDAFCQLKRVSLKKQSQSSTVARWLMTRDELARFSAALGRPGA